MKTGRAGDVDLGHTVANHVDAGQQQATRGQDGANCFANLTVTRTQGLGHALTACSQVATHLAALRDARQAVGHRLAANHQHAFVALGDFGQELLHHHGLRALAVQGLNDAAQVQPIRPDAENADATHAVQRFEDDVAVFGVELLDGGGIACHQRRADELRELHDRQLLGVVPQGAWLVEDLGPLALSLLQQMRGVEILAVKGRVFAHDDGIKVFQLTACFIG